MPGATWSYVDPDGNLLSTYTAEGPVTWDYGTHASLAVTYFQDGEPVETGRTYLACTAEGLAQAGAEVTYGEMRYVTQIEPPALWVPRDLAVGDTWSASSEAAMDVYDADGTLLERQGAPVEYEMTATRAEEVAVPGGTFSAVVVDLNGELLTYAEGVGLVRMNTAQGDAFLSTYTVP